MTHNKISNGLNQMNFMETTEQIFHLAVLIIILSTVSLYTIPEVEVTGASLKPPESSLTTSFEAFIPDSLKKMLREDSWFIVEDSSKLWVYDADRWQKVSNNLTSSEQKALEALIKTLKEKNVPSSVKNKRPMKLRKYNIHFLPENTL